VRAFRLLDVHYVMIVEDPRLNGLTAAHIANKSSKEGAERNAD
jgi:hypothetical protein